MTPKLFNKILFLFLPIILVLRIAGVGRVAGIPVNYYLWLIFYIFLLIRHIRLKYPIHSSPILIMSYILCGYVLLSFYFHDYPVYDLIKRFGIFIFYMVIPIIISHSMGLYKKVNFLHVYYKFSIRISILFIIMFTTGLVSDGFYLPGSNRNAIVFLLTPAFVYFYRNRYYIKPYKIYILMVAIILSLSRAAFLMIMLVFAYEIIFPTNKRGKKKKLVSILFKKLRLHIVIYVGLIYLILMSVASHIPILYTKIKKMDVIFSGDLVKGDIDKEQGDYRRSVLMKQAVDIIKLHTYFGIGFGATLNYLKKLNVTQRYRAMPHDLYLLLLAENGIIGTIIVFLIFLFHYKNVIKISSFKHIGRLTFLALFLISVGNEYLITSPWFSLWLGLMSVYPYQLKKVSKKDIEYYYQNEAISGRA